jgi:rhodanese-related sulfurtransferase
MVENVSPRQAWDALRDDPQAQLVDVRTQAEWAYVGVPDLTDLGKQVLTLEWQVFPAMDVNQHFVEELRAVGLGPEQRLYFLCRSGVRSLHAARAAIGAGWLQAFNISDGFEGPHDPEGHRGTVAGWKVEGLPWRQR